MSSGRPLNRPDGGQSTIEFAFALLLLAAIGVIGINSIVVVQHQIDVTAIAREAALAAARAADPYSEAYRVATSHQSQVADVVLGTRQVTVHIRRPISSVLGVIGLSDVRASVTMPLEPP